MAGQRYRAAVCATGLCRLAGVYGPDHRLYGQGERRFDPHHPLWLLCGLCRRAVPGGGCTPAGVLPALYALHRGGGLGQAGAGRQVGAYHGGKSVHRSMAGGLRHAAHHDAV